MEGLLDAQDRAAQPRVGGQDQVPERLREGPLAAHRHLGRAGGHCRDTGERGRPGMPERGPGCPQGLRIAGAAPGPAGEAPVKLSFDERRHVDAVDQQGAAVALQEPRRVDVRSLHIDPAHHHTGQVGPGEPGTAQVRAGEFRVPQLIGPGEGNHDHSSSSAPGMAGLAHRSVTDPR